MLYDRRDFGLLCLAGAYQWLPLASNLSAQQAGFTFSLRIDQNVDCFLGFLRHSQVHFFVIGHGFHLTAHYSQYIRHSQHIDYDKVIVGEKNDKLPPLL